MRKTVAGFSLLVLIFSIILLISLIGKEDKYTVASSNSSSPKLSHDWQPQKSDRFYVKMDEPKVATKRLLVDVVPVSYKTPVKTVKSVKAVKPVKSKEKVKKVVNKKTPAKPKVTKPPVKKKAVTKARPNPAKVTPAVKVATTKPMKQVIRATRSETDLLIRLVSAEAKGQPFRGQVAVAAVLINRVQSDVYGGTIREEVYRKGQFQPVRNGAINRRPVESAIRAVEAALRGSDPSNGALYFYNPAISNGSPMPRAKVTAVIADHTFLR